MIRQAVIPAAGRGLRLDRPGTPKPIVDVGGQPIVVRLMHQLCRSGIERIVIVLGFEAAKIQRILSKQDFAQEVVFVHNPEWELGLARSIVAAESSLDKEAFVLAMSDHVFDEGLVREVVSSDVEEGFGLAVVEERVGEIFALDTAVKVRVQEEVVTEMGSDLDRFNAVDTGLFAFSSSFMGDLRQAIRPGRENQLAMGLASAMAEGRLRAMTAFGRVFDDVDTPAALVHCEMRLREERRRGRTSRIAVASDTGAPSMKLDYRIDSPKTTEMLVGRGFVSNPAALTLIPDTAASSPIFVFTDETVNALYGREFIEKISALGYDVHGIVLAVGEESKSLISYTSLVERVLGMGVDERSVFISLGGGVVCNVCGFVASTIYRGLDLVHLPTTLMSQCDAAISHKQGINGYQGKNLVGSYYSPRLVAVDVQTLSTLPDRLLFDGMAEVIKHALGQDPAYVEMLMSYNGSVRNLDFLEEVIRRNVALKCALVRNDPKEHREGMILQYGHTIGHAVEHLTGYSLYHGESVGVGMAAAARVSRLLGGCRDELVALHDRLIAKYRLPTRIPASIRSEDIAASLRYSKRFLVEGTRMALLKDVGSLWSVDNDFVIPVSEQVLSEAIAQCKEGVVS